jgi:hypothetical protein
MVATMVVTKPSKLMFQQCAGREAATYRKSSLGLGIEIVPSLR